MLSDHSFRSGTTTHSRLKNTNDRTPATVAAALFVTRSKTSHTMPDVVRASAAKPARAALLAAATSQGRWTIPNGRLRVGSRPAR